ncbi:MAG: hypothetical protein WB562_07225 [Candidatus Sulfotelmatobacter sp.]
MLGRRCWGLFVVSLILAIASSLRGQSAATNPASARELETSPTSPAPATSSGQLFLPRPPGAPSIPRQLPPRQPAPPGVIAFPQMVHAAGIIFSGHVVSVARDPASGGAGLETIAITFHIDRAFRGASTGTDLTIHEWSGLWSSGQRYRAGERVLLFLYPPSKLGLTSCVAGPVGRFTVDSVGRVLLSDRHLSVLNSDPILARKSRVSLDDLGEAVRRGGGEERVQP